MTAGMTTTKMEGARVSLPRAGLGALLAATLLAGSVAGAAIYAGIGAVTASSAVHAGAASVTSALPGESVAVRDARMAAGNGQLSGDARGLPSGGTKTTNFPAGRDGFGYDQPESKAPAVSITHAPGRGQLP